MVNAAVEISKENDPYKAGMEVVKNIIHKLNGKPDLILLYFTGNYHKKDGVKSLLDGIWKNLTDETIVVGGTVNGFVTNQGCYAKGVAALALEDKKMNLNVFYGKNIKRNPKKAAKQFLKNIKNNLEKSYKNKLLITNVSGGETLKFSGNNKIIKSKFLTKIIINMLGLIQKTKQKGFPRDDEFLKIISKHLPGLDMIHVSGTSLLDYSINYQILNKKVLTESAIGLLIESDLDYFLNYSCAAVDTNIKIDITKISKDRHIIKKINNKPALLEFLRLMNWTKDDFEKEKWLSILTKYPFAYLKENKIILRPILMIFGNYLGCLSQIEKNNLFIAEMSTENMVNSLNELLIPEIPEFGFFNSCVARQGLLGLKVFQIQEKLKNYFKDKPFLLIYSGGEAIKKKNQDVDYFNQTITCSIFKK